LSREQLAADFTGLAISLAGAGRYLGSNPATKGDLACPKRGPFACGD